MTKRLLTLLSLAAAGLLGPTAAAAADAPRFVHVLTVYADDQDRPFNHPEGVGCRDGAIVVGDSENGRLVAFSLAGGTLSGGTEIKTPQLPLPIRVRLDSKGGILALDGKSRKIYRFAADGKLLGPVTLQGGGGDWVPRSFALDGADGLYLLDVFGGRVILAGADGRYQGEIPLPEGDGFFSDLAVNAQGTIYVLDSVNSSIHAAAKGAKTFSPLALDRKEDMHFPTFLTVDRQGLLYVVDRNGGGIILFGPDGSLRGRQLALGWKPGLLYYPSQLCLTGEDEAVIADRDNSRVQVFKLAR